MSVHTPVCELLGIESPIVQAPLSADPRLPAAVSNAGGLTTPETWFVKRRHSPTGLLPAISFLPRISTVDSIRHLPPACGSCRF
jgi:hypothetical protein